MADLHHDDSTMLVAPPRLGFPYIARHWAVHYSFVPANRLTLKLLADRYIITTLIYDRKDPMDLTVEDILDQGLRPFCMMSTIANDCVVYRRPSYSGEENEWEKDRVLRVPPRFDFTD